MKITIIGAGHMGSAIACDLVKRDHISIVQVCDAHRRSLNSIESRVDSPKLRLFHMDARDATSLTPILAGSDCVIGASTPSLNPDIARSCISIGSPFCDLGGGYDDGFSDPNLARDARTRGLWIIPNCGLDPGLVNILCLYGIEQFDRAESAQILIGNVPLHPEPPFNFRIAWSAEKLVSDYTTRAYVARDGKLVPKEPLEECEPISFGDSFPNLEAFLTSSTLTDQWSELGLGLDRFDHKAIRWPGHAEQMRLLLALGFGEQKNLDIRTHLTYRDVFVRRLKQRLGGSYKDVVLLRVEICGELDGTSRKLTFELVEHYNEETEMTAMRTCTALSAATVAVMLARKKIPGGGLLPPEQVLPKDEFVRKLVNAGLDIRQTWDEDLA